MKKLFAILIIGFCLSLPLSTAGFAEEEFVRVTRVKGKATLIRGGQALPVQENDKIQKNDTIKTDSDGTVDLSVNDMAGYRLLPSTESTVASAQKEDMHVKVDVGDIIVNVENLRKNMKPTSFKVETRTAIAAVRGTQFSGHADISDSGKPTSTFAVRDEKVDVLNLTTGEQVTIHEGEALDIPADFAGDLSPRNAFDNELAILDQASSIKTNTCS